MQTNKIFNLGVYLVETDKGPRLFHGFTAAASAAKKHNSVISGGGAR